MKMDSYRLFPWACAVVCVCACLSNHDMLSHAYLALRTMTTKSKKQSRNPKVCVMTMRKAKADRKVVFIVVVFGFVSFIYTLPRSPEW